MTDRVGAGELLSGGAGGGRVVPAGDVAALAGALAPYLADPALAAEEGAAATAAASRECDPDVVARQRLLVYESVARRAPDRRA